MASTYTTRLGLEKQTDGENPNSWGAILNTNVIDLIDDAIAGYEIVSVSSTGITLTDNQGSTDQSRNAALEFAGTLTANVTITVPAEEKTYFIRENTSGSFAVQMKTDAGTALTLSQGVNTFVACNGTSIYQLDAPTSVTSFTANTLTATSITTSILDATEINASTKVSAAALTVVGIVSATAMTVSGNVSATAYYGSGANLTGLSTAPVPVGAIMPYAGSSAPSGWLLSFGQALNRTTYADLFTAIGTTYGAGDGSTTFNAPDMRGYVVAGQDDMGGTSANRLTGLSGGVDGDVLGGTGGSEVHTLTEAQLAAHTHGAGSYTTTIPLSGGGAEGGPLPSTAATTATTTISAAIAGSSGSAGSNSSHNNVQPTFILNYIIKT